ncbi:unnamed protein product, partial [Phaeothamnion confervicola]
MSQESPPTPSRGEWMADSSSSSCVLCDMPFTLTNRRHHCRACFMLVCSKCSARTYKLGDSSKGRTTQQRVCEACFASLDATRQVETTTSASAATASGSPTTQRSVLFMVHVLEARGPGLGRAGEA